VSAKRRRASPWPWVLASLALLLLPAAFSQKIRLAALGGFLPFRALARNLVRLPSSGEVQELRTENDYLKDQVQKLLGEQARLSGLLEQATGLKPLVRDARVRLLQADVVFPADGSPWRKSLAVAAGTRDGVARDQIVVYHQQFIGRVVEAGPWTCRVQVVTDPSFRAAAVAVPGSRNGAEVALSERQVGVFEGTAGRGGQLKWLAGDAAVEHGALVLSTEDPANGVPRGLILGRVQAVDVGRGRYPVVQVEPCVDYRALERVSILVPQTEEARR
jgi:rod shape-determining protein MreC